MEVNRLSLPHDLALVGRPQPGDRLDRHRLAGAVVARQRRHLSRRDVEIDPGQRLHGAEPLGDPAERQQRRPVRAAAVGRWRRRGSPKCSSPPSVRRAPPVRRKGPRTLSLRRGSLDQLVIPAALQSAAYLPAHSCAAGTKLSLTTVSFMFVGVTHSGHQQRRGHRDVRRRVHGRWRSAASPAPVFPARRYIASATAACASR